VFPVAAERPFPVRPALKVETDKVLLLERSAQKRKPKIKFRKINMKLDLIFSELNKIKN
jgi:hypothetical protein